MVQKKNNSAICNKKHKSTPVKRRKKTASSKNSKQSLSASDAFKALLGFAFLFVIACFIFIPDRSIAELNKLADTFGAKSEYSTQTSIVTTNTTSVNSKAVTTISTSKTKAKTTVKSSTTKKTTTSARKTAVTTSTRKTTQKTTVTTKKVLGKPDHIRVFLNSQRVVVYDKSNNILKSFICSSGKASSPTEVGTYAIHHKYRWRLMKGDCYAQYASAFSGSYLFHSVPYYKEDASTLMNGAYDVLGQPASAGCIRLCFRDTKWIYDNCPIGTSVIVENKNAPKGISPEPIVPRKKGEKYSGWDPTDTSTKSPYNQ